MTRPNFTMPVEAAAIRRPTPLPARPADLAWFTPGQVVQKGELKGTCVRHPLVKLRHSNDKDQKVWKAAILRELDKAGLRPDEPYNGPAIIWVVYTRAPLQRRGPWWPMWCTQPDGDKLERCVWDTLTKVIWFDDGRAHRWGGEKWEALSHETPGAHIHIWLMTPDDLAAERQRLEIS